MTHKPFTSEGGAGTTFQCFEGGEGGGGRCERSGEGVCDIPVDHFRGSQIQVVTVGSNHVRVYFSNLLSKKKRVSLIREISIYIFGNPFPPLPKSWIRPWAWHDADICYMFPNKVKA